MNSVMEALTVRHACKLFDENRKIAEDDLDLILEAGRLSPSSYGLEPWHFLVISDPKLKQLLKPAFSNQPQITTCSHLVIALFRRRQHFELTSPYLRQAMQRQLSGYVTNTDVDRACQQFINYYTHCLARDVTVDRWSEMQCYIAMTNMMTAAASIHVDSCALGGFDYQRLIATLERKIDLFTDKSYGVALAVAFGYRVYPPSEKIRWSAKDVFTFI